MEYNIFSVPAASSPGKTSPGQLVDLNEKLVRNRESTFFLRVNSEAMKEAGISKGDVVIVDRSIPPANGKIVIVMLDGELIIRRFEIQNHKKRLLPASNRLSPIEINEGAMFSIWGVVTYVIHSL